MPLKKELIIAITEHPILGVLLQPYIITKKPNHGFHAIEARISKLNISKYIAEFTEQEKKLCQLADEYSDQTLAKVFSKKKDQTSVDFINTLKKDFANLHIRPYIEKRLIKITDLLQEMDIEVYYKGKPQYINSDDQVYVAKGKAQTVFNITKLTNESQYFLTVRHENKELNLLEKTFQIIVNDPCRIIINNTLLNFEDINAKKLLPFFDKACIHIPKTSEKKWYETFALESIKQFNVKATGFAINNTINEKEAVISLEYNLSGQVVLVPSFIYNNEIRFEAFKGNYCSAALEIKNGEYIFTKTERDKVWEETIINELKNLGLQNIQDNYLIPELLSDLELQTKNYETIQWIGQHSADFGNLGVKFIQKNKDKEFCFIEPVISSQISDKNDWFDVFIEVQFGEFSIPFTKFRKHILTGNREYKLPNGQIAILPAEWFEQYKELFLYGHDHENHLQLEKHHFSVLESGIKKDSGSIIEKYKNIIENYDKLDTPIPEGLNATLRPYQEEGFRWMTLLQQNKFGGCLADDMGLGKTIQTLTMLLNSRGKGNGTFVVPDQKQAIRQLSIFDIPVKQKTITTSTSMIVMPTSLIHNWLEEIKKFTPQLKAFKFTGQNRSKNLVDFSKYDIILTTYGVVRNDFELLRTFPFYYIILDESQYIKNPDSKIYKSIIQLKSEHRLVLTGTPIENSLTDLWAQINFLNRGLLGNLRFFKHEFVQAIEKNNDSKKRDRLQQFIQPFVLRRTKGQVAKDLPDKSESVIYCDMTEEQKSIYEEEKSKIRNSILETIEKTADKPTILAIEGLSKLRQISNHPVLIDENYTGESGKFDEITRNIENLIAEKHKVLVFSAYVKHLNLVSKYLKEHNQQFSMLTGSTNNRQQVIEEFQSSADNHVFLIQIRAGGVGLNLTSADYVFIIDPWWNPAVEEQAINRTHRIGQDKKVMVYRFISADTVEEKIQNLKAKKTELAESFISTEQAVKSFNLETILELLN
ncbi:MAG: DEAD/DEAH box helicase [Bacteroidales bacterium]|jgi:SNF2 family DNA or RNA helicase|nr:DEAD/DEAH box helicase [Bacteroidales bacterium]